MLLVGFFGSWRSPLWGSPFVTALDLTAIPPPTEFPIARLTEGGAIGGLQTLLHEDAAKDRFTGAVLVAKNGRCSSAPPTGRRIANEGSRTPSRHAFASGR